MAQEDSRQEGRRAERWARVNFPNKFVHPHEYTARDGRVFDKMFVSIPPGVTLNGVDLGGYAFDHFAKPREIEQKANGRPVAINFRPGEPVRLFRGVGPERRTLEISNPWDLCRAVKAHNIDFRAALIDSASAGYDEAYAILEAARASRAGKTLEECVSAACDAIARSRFLFAPRKSDVSAKGRAHRQRESPFWATWSNWLPCSRCATAARWMWPRCARRKRCSPPCSSDSSPMWRAAASPRRWSTTSASPTRRAHGRVMWWSRILGHEVAVRPVSPRGGILHVGAPAAGIAYRCERPVEGKISGDVSSLVAYV